MGFYIVKRAAVIRLLCWLCRSSLRMPSVYLKGTVSRDGRWGLLYINRKLFLRRIVADDKILIFLKGHFTIYIKQLCDSIAE